MTPDEKDIFTRLMVARFEVYWNKSTQHNPLIFSVNCVNEWGKDAQQMAQQIAKFL